MTKSKIKIIRKSGGNAPEPEVKEEPTKLVETNNRTKQITANISEWVEDFKQKKEEETNVAFKNLFVNG